MARAKTKAQAAVDTVRLVDDLEGFPESSYVSRIETNLMAAQGRPESVDLGRTTVLVGANGAGKSRLLYALGLLLNRGADDVMGRSDPVRQAAMVAKMVPPGVSQVYARLRLSQGPEDGQTWEAVDAKTLGSAVPGVYGAWADWLTPVAKVQGWLHSSADVAVQALSPWIVGDLSEDQVRAALPEDLRDLTGIEVPDDSFQPVVFDLSSVAGLTETVGSISAFQASVQDALKVATASATALQAECDALQVASPDEGMLAEQQARVAEVLLQVEALAKKEALASDVARFTELKARLAKAKDVIAAHEATREQIPQPSSEPPEAPGGNKAAKLRALLGMIERGRKLREEAQEIGLKWCPCSGLDFEDSGIAELDRREQTVKERLNAATGSTKAYQRALAEYEAEQAAYKNALQAHAARQLEMSNKRDALTEEYRSLGTRLKALKDDGVDLSASVDPDAMARVQAKHAAEVEQLNRMTAVAALFKRTRDAQVKKKRLDTLAAQAAVLLSAVKSAQRQVVSEALTSFNAAVSNYLPDGWAFRLRLENERGNKVCEIGLVIDGQEWWMLSGAQYTIALFALTATILDRLPCGRPPLAIFWPPGERGWSSDKLSEALAAMAKIPYQIILPSTVMPDVVPAGVTVVALGMLTTPVKAPEAAEPKKRGRKKKEPLSEEGGLTLKKGRESADTSDFVDLSASSPADTAPVALAQEPVKQAPIEVDDDPFSSAPDAPNSDDSEDFDAIAVPNFEDIEIIQATPSSHTHPWATTPSGGEDDDLFDL